MNTNDSTIDELSSILIEDDFLKDTSNANIEEGYYGIKDSSGSGEGSGSGSGNGSGNGYYSDNSGSGSG